MLHSYRTPSWFDLMCCFSVYWCLVVKLHWSQVIGFIAKWIIWWFCKYCFLLKAVLHWSQIKALRFEWRVWWSLNLPLLDKDFSHWGQAWVLSMLCLAWCLIKSALFLKHLLHFSHWWGFKFMWTIWWPFNTNLFLTALPHCKQDFFDKNQQARRCHHTHWSVGVVHFSKILKKGKVIKPGDPFKKSILRQLAALHDYQIILIKKLVG